MRGFRLSQNATGMLPPVVGVSQASSEQTMHDDGSKAAPVVSSYPHPYELAELRSGFCPSEAEKAVIEERLARANEKRMAITEELLRSDDPKTQVQLEELVDTVNNYMAAQHCLLSPIRRLPKDILSRIFKFYRPELVFFDPSPTENDFVIRQICSHWRSVVVGCNELWADFVIDFKGAMDRLEEPDPSLLVDQANRLLNVCIVRSGDHPIRFGLFMPTSIVGYASDLLAQLWAVTDRWKLVSLNMDVRQFASHAPKHYELPILHEVVIADREADYRPDLKLFSSAPKLTRLELDFRRPKQLGLPWSQITYLSWCTPLLNAGDYIDALQRMPNLEEMELANKELESTVSGQSVRLPRLRTLKIDAGGRSFKNVMQAIEAPALTTLHIYPVLASEYDDTLSAKPVVAFIRRSGCHLKELSLKRFEPPGVMQILEMTPDLEHLMLDSRNLWRKGISEILEALVGPDPSNPLQTTSTRMLLKLRSFYYNCGIAEDIPLMEMLTLMRVRSPKEIKDPSEGVPIESATLEYCVTIDEAHFEEFEKAALEDIGVDITMKKVLGGSLVKMTWPKELSKGVGKRTGSIEGEIARKESRENVLEMD
ncbi:hypothetical protein BDQ12DRAFT_253643 [Crucibulum laeve]|uniref:F-box domain-containing protein n=1 Tax=Crucibulum laeve TaxID=68775 RepID=A0A5C3LSU7_9AGAR|nr:hypothetical protein BDQ12DRAFT_253643 [Crucibulum laeve]